MQTKKIEYKDNETLLEGYYAYTGRSAEKRPAVLIAHDWTGCNEFSHKKAEQLAELGYVGFAIDMYGKGIFGRDNDEKSLLIRPFMQDRQQLLQRIKAALTTLQSLEMVDTSRIAAMGFCFGGLCVLDLARSGADLRGVISFHGLLMAPQEKPSSKIKAKILALHGYDDPMAPPDQLLAFANEMTVAKADWEIDMYGHTKHAFTNPVANDPTFGTVYAKEADQRSWIAMKNFLTEVFGDLAQSRHNLQD